MDDRKLELESLRKLQKVIQDQISTFGNDGADMDMDMEMESKAKPEEEEIEIDSESPSKELEDVVGAEEEDEEEENPFKKYLEGSDSENSYKPKGKLMGGGMTTISVTRKKLGKK